jgi:hypothetical protein
MNINLELELSDLLHRIKELRSASKYISDESAREEILRIADALDASETRIRAELE